MPVVHKSTIKRARQSEKRQQRNRAILSGTKIAVKKVKTAVSKDDTDAAKALLREANSVLQRAVTKGTLKKNTASRRISKLALQVNKLKQN